MKYNGNWFLTKVAKLYEDGSIIDKNGCEHKKSEYRVFENDNVQESVIFGNSIGTLKGRLTNGKFAVFHQRLGNYELVGEKEIERLLPKEEAAKLYPHGVIDSEDYSLHKKVVVGKEGTVVALLAYPRYRLKNTSNGGLEIVRWRSRKLYARGPSYRILDPKKVVKQISPKEMKESVPDGVVYDKDGTAVRVVAMGANGEVVGKRPHRRRGMHEFYASASQYALKSKEAPKQMNQTVRVKSGLVKRRRLVALDLKVVGQTEDGRLIVKSNLRYRVRLRAIERRKLSFPVDCLQASRKVASD